MRKGRFTEEQTARLKRLVAERDFEIEVMKEVAAKEMAGARFGDSRSSTRGGRMIDRVFARELHGPTDAR